MLRRNGCKMWKSWAVGGGEVQKLSFVFPLLQGGVDRSIILILNARLAKKETELEAKIKRN